MKIPHREKQTKFYAVQRKQQQHWQIYVYQTCGIQSVLITVDHILNLGAALNIIAIMREHVSVGTREDGRIPIISSNQ